MQVLILEKSNNMTKYRFEVNGKLDDFIKAGGAELAVEHWEELEKGRYGIDECEIDWYYMEEMEQKNAFCGIMVFADDELVGYNAILLLPSFHYMGRVEASSTAIYIKPEHRRGRIGLKLIEATEHMMRQRGALFITYHSAPWAPQLEKILQRKGYVTMSHNHTKILGAKT